MTYSFNLIDEPWIPCLWPDGTSRPLGLRETLLQAHQLREIRGDTPLETAALHRLLLAILHRVFGPNNPTNWKSLWCQSSFSASKLEAYLLTPEISARFDIFGEGHRFYQVRDSRAGEKSVISLVIHTASGNNATLFDHSTESVGLSLAPAQAARALIVAQMFGIGGLSGLPEKFTDAPCAKGVLFFATGANVFETLVLNLIRYDEEAPIPIPDSDDCPAWEMEDPFVPTRSRPKGYLDYLTWHNRRIWLFPEETDGKVVVRHMSWAPGLVLEADGIDPMKHYSADKQGDLQPLCFTAGRAMWRDSSVLFELGGSAKPPLVVRWLAGLSQPPHSVLDAARQYQLTALGMAKSKASLEFLRAEALPLPTSLLIKQERVGDLSHAVQAAEHAASALQRATFVLAWLLLYPTTDNAAFDAQDKIELRIGKGRNPKSDDKDAQHAYRLHSSWGIERYFWADLEPYFHRMIQDLPDRPEKAMQTWQDEVQRAAKTAFQQTESHAAGDSRAQRAVALARQWFNIGLAAAVGKANAPQSEEGGDEE